MAAEKQASTPNATPARKSSGTRKSSSAGASTSTRQASAPRAQAPKRTSAGQVAERAAGQLLALTGKEPEGVTGLERTDDGWTVLVDVVELRRIPATTDVLATYEVEVDSDGDLLGYRRIRRFVRGSAGDESR